MFGSANIPAHVSLVMMLPLVQLLSQPPSALQLLDHTQALSDCRCRAEILLEQLQASHGDLGWRDGVTPPACSGSLSGMADSMQQYLCVVQQPALSQAWLEIMPRRLSSKNSEYLALLVAALANGCVDRLQVFKSALNALSSLAEAFPSLVSPLATAKDFI